MKKILYLFLLICSTSLLYSKEGSLVLTGKVLDGETSEPLVGATVQVLEEQRGAFTDTKGRFRIAGLKPTVYSLKVSYVGYETKVIQNVETVKENEVVVPLYPEIKATKEVTIEATRINDNEAAMLSMKKNSINLSDGISITEIKRLPDRSLVSALRRISGVTLMNDFVIVRGIGERYNLATLNGTTLPSTETDKRAFSFDLYPSDFIENVNLVKSYTPDLPGSFTGGLVQLNTVDFPASNAFKVSFSTNSNSVTTFRKNSYVFYRGGKLDWLGFDDGTRKLPSSFPSNRREFNELLNRANNPFDTTNAKQTFESVAKSLSNKTLKTERRTILPFDNRNVNLQYLNSFDLSDYLLGVTFNGLYSNEHKILQITRNTYLSNFDTIYATQGSKSLNSVNLGAMLNLAIKTPSNQIYSWKNSFVNNADDEVLILEGTDKGYQFIEFKNFSLHYTQKTLFNTSFTGNNFLEPLGLKIDWNVGYSLILRDEPDYRRFKFSRALSNVELDPQTPFSLEVLPNQQGDGTRAGRFFANTNENSLNAKVDLERSFENLKIKFGFLTENRKRNFNARSITITMSPYIREDIYEKLSLYDNLGEVFAPENFSYDDGLRIGEDSKLSDSYSSAENLLAGYFMLDQRFNIFGLSTRIIGGLRLENNLIKLNSHKINDEPVNINYKTFDLLPSLNLIFLTDKMSNLRFSVARTLARPSFREFAPFAFYDYYEMALVQGNPNLKRSLIDNFDLRYEIFPTSSELYSLGIFYKEFQNAIEETIYPQQSELTRTFENADGVARNFGFELELRKNLGSFWHILDNFSLVSNFAWISSKITVRQGGVGTEDVRPMWGQSPYTLNVALFYQNSSTGTLVSLAYNTYGKRIVKVSQKGIYNADDPHIYELPQHYLDLSFGQRIGMFDLRLSIKNILGAETILEQAGRRWATNKFGNTITFGISYTLN
ncbi:MAG: carboxypeptidase-like regulatory domain-containing protein [Ignavibacteria bacterium]|nr:carboxypeptidase-like regulatory domain-containing protein [Ignavibacteria bacterium]